MNGASTTLEILVKLKDEASSAMQGLGSNLQSIGKSISDTGKTMTQDITLPLIAFGTYAIKGAMDFQQAMTLIQTQAGASATEVQDLSKQVMDLATSSQQGPTELAQGLYHLISLGLNASDAMKALKLASEGAAVGQANLEDVTNALGGVISSGIKGASNYTDAMAVLNATVGSGNMRMQDLTAALGTGVLAAAKETGMSLTDVGAALATMTDNAIPAVDAATRLRMTFSLMASPTTAAKKAFQEIGMTQFQLADDMRNKGLLGALTDLENHLKASGKTADEQMAIITKAFGGARTGTTMELLLQQLDRMKSKYVDIGNGMKNFDSDVQAQSNTWNGEMQNMNANFQVFRDTVGVSLLQIAGQVFPIMINALKDLVAWWENLSPGMQKAIIYAAMFVAAIGPVLVIIGTLISAIGSIITVLAAVTAAIGIWPLAIGAVLVIIAAVFVIYWTQIKKFLTETWSWITALFTTSLQGIQTLWNAVWGGVSTFFIGIWDGIRSSLSSALDFLRTTISTFVNWATGVFAPVMNAVNAIRGAASGVGSAIGGAVSGAASMLHLASGGIVSSPTIALIGESGPEAVVPLSLLGSSGGGGGGGFGGITINISGGQYYTDRQSVIDFANKLAKIIVQQIKVTNYKS